MGTFPSHGSPPRLQAFIKPDNEFITTLTIAVPADTAAGTYSGHLLADARGSHGISDPGTGIGLMVHVPAACSEAGQVSIDSFGPAVLWPPNHSLETVTVKGTVLMPSGCTLLEARYLIDDEYGIYSGGDKFHDSSGRNILDRGAARGIAAWAG